MKTASFFLIALLSVCHAATCCESDDAVDGKVVQAASKLLIEKHLRQDIDLQQLSRAWARQYLLTLDPLRMHFLASDVDEFMKRAHLLLAQAQQGQVEFPPLVVNRFRARLNANTLLIYQLLDAEYDFAIDESVQLKHRNYAVEEADCDERWRLRIKYELLMENPHDPNAKSSREFLRGRYSRIKEHFRSLTQSKMLSLYIDALAKALDPHSAYLDEQILAMFRTSLIPNYTLGMRLAYRHGDLWIVPSPRNTAFVLRALAGYRIVAVRLEGQEPIHLTGLTDGTAVRTIVSPIGELGRARAVTLDIDNPQLGKRKVVVCDRWLPDR